MNYKKIIAGFVAIGLLLSADCVEAKTTAKVENKSVKSKKQAVTVIGGSKGGISIVTDKDKATDSKKNKAIASKKNNAVGANKNKATASAKNNVAGANKNSVKAQAAKSMLVEKDGKSYFLGTELPADYKKVSIYGEAVATKEQAAALIKQNNPNVRLACSVEELVDLYWQEAEREGVRPDLALCQSMIETGTYAYGGDVQHHQNNFCGLGTTGGGIKGAAFRTPEIGVRAHIQHLLAYTQNKRPKTAIVDPRYELAHKIRMERGVVTTWYGLNGTWAMGSLYCEKIMATYQKMLAMQAAPSKIKQRDENKKQQSKQDKKVHRMRERVQELLKEKK